MNDFFPDTSLLESIRAGRPMSSQSKCRFRAIQQMEELAGDHRVVKMMGDQSAQSTTIGDRPIAAMCYGDASQAAPTVVALDDVALARDTLQILGGKPEKGGDIAQQHRLGGLAAATGEHAREDAAIHRLDQHITNLSVIGKPRKNQLYQGLIPWLPQLGRQLGRPGVAAMNLGRSEVVGEDFVLKGEIVVVNADQAAGAQLVE